MRVQIWIRDEDVEEWQTIGNKSQWIHDQLAGEEHDLDRKIRRLVREEWDKIAAERGGY